MLLAPYSIAGHHCFALVSAAAATTAEALLDDADVAVKMDVEMQVDMAEDVPCPYSTQLGTPTPPFPLSLSLSICPSWTTYQSCNCFLVKVNF